MKKATILLALALFIAGCSNNPTKMEKSPCACDRVITNVG